MRLNLDKQIIDTDGTPIKDDAGHLGKNVARLFHQACSGGGKLFEWGYKLAQHPHEIELDRPDKDMLIAWFETLHKNPDEKLVRASNLVVYSVVNAIKDQWDEQEKKK